MKKIITLFLALFCEIALLQAGQHILEDVMAVDLERQFPQFGKRERMVQKQIIECVISHHYSVPQLTLATSSRWFENYFDVLDPAKIYFTQEDIDDLRSYEGLLFKRQMGNSNVLPFAREAYILMLERMRERIVFVSNYLKSDIDFSVDEYISTDDKELQWAKNATELEERWRKTTKNILLDDIISKEIDAEREKDNSDENKEGNGRLAKKVDFKERLLNKLIDNFFMRLELGTLELLEPYFNAFCNLFDPHTSYLAPTTSDDFDIELSQSLHGIGATLKTEDSYIVIVDLIAGSPAERSGQLNIGDSIIAVAQENQEPVSIIDMPINRAVKMIRGPQGSKVILTIIPKNSNREVQVELIRDEIKLESGSANGVNREVELPDSSKANILIIKLPSFYRDFKSVAAGKRDFKSTTQDIIALINKEQQQHAIDGVILDLRFNGGGSLEEAIDLLGLFYDVDEPVLQVRGRYGVERLIAPDSGLLPTQPVIVLIDGASASASEIVAAALQDSKRAIVIGDRNSHGKGTVQNLVEINSPLQNLLRAKSASDQSDNGTIKITFQKFYRITGESTQRRGVVPDIIVPSPLDHMETREEFLPNALPWDKISSTSYNVFVSPSRAHLGDLIQLATNYMDTNENFLAYRKFVNDFGEYKKNKSLPLQRDKRKEFMLHENEIFKQLERITAKQNKKVQRDDDDKSSSQDDDPVLDMSCEVMKHMIELHRQ